MPEKRLQRTRAAYRMFRRYLLPHVCFNCGSTAVLMQLQDNEGSMYPVCGDCLELDLALTITGHHPEELYAKNKGVDSHATTHCWFCKQPVVPERDKPWPKYDLKYDMWMCSPQHAPSGVSE